MSERPPLAPIAVMCLVIGIFPKHFLDTFQPEVDAIAAIYSNEPTAARNAMNAPTVVQVENR